MATLKARGVQLSTAGVLVFYAPETTMGTQPTTGYVQIQEIKSIPELNPEPENLETTTLEETEWKTYIDGLKDPGGALTFTANLTEVLMNDWDAMCDEYDTLAAESKSLWYFIVIPGLTRMLAFRGKPARMGMPGMEVSAVLETSLYITPTNAPAFVTKPKELENVKNETSSPEGLSGDIESV